MKKQIDRLIFNWFSRYEAMKERQRQENLRRAANLAATAVVGAEGSIENLFGDPSAVKMGEYSYLRGRLITYGHGGRIDIGDWCYIGARSEIWSMNSIVIGNRVLIAHDVNIHDGDAHSKNAEERHRHYRHILEKGHPRSWDDMPGVQSAPIVIEDDVWISFGATILKGVRIGKGSVIAAGALVTRNVPPGVLYKCQVAPIMKEIK